MRHRYIKIPVERLLTYMIFQFTYHTQRHLVGNFGNAQLEHIVRLKKYICDAVISVRYQVPYPIKTNKYIIK